MSETVETKTEGVKAFAFKTTSKSLIADLKALQHKHGVFAIGTVDTKDLVKGAIGPANFGLVLIRGKNNKLNHVILTDENVASIISVTSHTIKTEPIAPPPSEKIQLDHMAIVPEAVGNFGGAIVGVDEAVGPDKTVVTGSPEEIPPIGENESPDEWAKRAFPNGVGEVSK